MRTFTNSRSIERAFTPSKPQREASRYMMYGKVKDSDWAMRQSRRSASLRAVPIFVVTALRAAAAIARRGTR